MAAEGRKRKADDPVSTSPSAEAEAKTCTCYCLVRWIAALPAPDVALPGFPKVSTDWTRLIDTETEEGQIFWTADVEEKTYDCTTKAVTGQTTHSAVNLAKEIYVQYRTRPITVGVGWFFLMPYPTFTPGAWGAPIRTVAPNSDKEALGTASPAFLPWCSDEGVTCP